ncbi:MAG: S8/S53 family peptidase, partial [Spirochaetaceae bacterium]|nr:S8/S53 family peptidase [Spirochaetaceae bacterium]
MRNVYKIQFSILFNLCLLSSFSQETQEYGYLVAYIIDTNTVTHNGKQLINIDDNLNNAFKAFNVFSYRYAYPKTKNDYLRGFVAIECNCNVDQLAAFLNENYSDQFSDIEYAQDLGHPHYDPSDPMWYVIGPDGIPWLWHLKIIEADKAWDITKGSLNITIAILDLGFDISHPDLENKIVSTTDSYTGNPFGYYPNVPSHGTTVASFAGAETDGGGLLASVGFNTMLRFYDYGYKSAADYAYHASFEKGADVISFSWGGVTFASEREKLLVKEVLDNNTVIVRSAGNDQYTTDNDLFPFAYQVDNRIIIVTSTDKDDNHTNYAGTTHASFSQVSICAPGYRMMGATRYDNGNTSTWPYYGSCVGTSFAAPIVAGVCALLKSINKCLSSTDIKYIIQTTADPIADAHLYPSLKAGRVNAYKAVAMAQSWTNDSIITSSQVWNSKKRIYGNVIINPSVTLTVTDTIELCSNVSINIHPGAKLILNGGTLTNACEGEMWQGITVLGNPNQPLQQQHQGYVQILNGGKIENATTGIHATNGGI